VPDLECIVDGDCALDEVCVENVCVPDLECIVDGDCALDEVCVDNVCVPGSIDLDPVTKVVGLGCNNTALAQTSDLPAVLTVDPGVVSANSSFTAELSGALVFPKTFLDVAQNVVGAIQAAQVNQAQGTVVASGGATGADVVLSIDPNGVCLFDANVSCDITNNDPLKQTNPACVPNNIGGIIFNTCGPFVLIPTTGPSSFTNPTATCAPCDALGPIEEMQCARIGTDEQFCITGALPLPLDTVTAQYTAGNSGELLLFAWQDAAGTADATLKTCLNNPTNLECFSNNPNCQTTGNPAQQPVCAYDGPYADGSNSYYSVPSPLGQPVGDNGLRVNAGGLSVGVDCIGARVNNRLECDEDTCSGDNSTPCPNGDSDCTGNGTCQTPDDACGCSGGCQDIVGPYLSPDDLAGSGATDCEPLPDCLTTLQVP
jgi:hypothetical protein